MPVVSDGLASRSSVGVNDLPPELLAAIFELAVDHSGRLYSVGRLNSTSISESSKDLVCISHVSRHFRAIALFTRLIWTQIHITFDKARSSSLLLSSLFLSRSSPCAISLTLSIPSFFVYPHLRGALHTLAKNIQNAKTLRVELGLKYGRDVVLREILGWLSAVGAPALRTLELIAQDSAGCTSVTAPRFSTDPFPAFACLLLHNVALNWDIPEFRGLSALELDYACSNEAPSFEDLGTMVKSSLKLKKLVLAGGAGLRIPELVGVKTEVGPFKLDSLMELDVDLSRGPEYAEYLFRTFHMSSLRSLNISRATFTTWTAFLLVTTIPAISAPMIGKPTVLLSPTTTASHTTSFSTSSQNNHQYRPHLPFFPFLDTLTLRSTPSLITPEFAAATPRLQKLVLVECEQYGYADLARFLGRVSPEKVRDVSYKTGTREHVINGGEERRRDRFWIGLRDVFVVERKCTRDDDSRIVGVLGERGVRNGVGIGALRAALARRRACGFDVKLEVVEA